MCSILFLVSLEVILRSLQAQKSCTMKEYKDVGSNALIAYNASDAIDVTDATTGRQEQEAERQSLQIRGQLEMKTEENDLESPGVLKAISKNAAKQ